ncbi:integrase catalytic domain-containing protein, partial [Nephila pilipes]
MTEEFADESSFYVPHHTVVQEDKMLSVYGCVIFLQGVTLNNRVIVKFVCSKSRVTPLKSLTLPHSELFGCLLSAGLFRQVSKCLKFEAKCYFWIDSNICEHWIKEKENTADILSRSISALPLANNFLWRHEPPWQSKPSEYWAGKIEIGNHMGDLELRKEYQIIVQNKCVVHVSQFDLYLNMYSDLHKVLKIIASIKRFVNKKLPIEIGSCNATELLKADQDLIKYEQNLVSTSELECIKAQLPKYSVLEYPPFTVTGIDFTGLILRSGKDSQQKSYIDLFTSAITQVLHIELITDTTTKSFFLSIRGFLTIR